MTLSVRDADTRRTVSTGILLGLCVVVFSVGFLTASALDLYSWDFRQQYIEGARDVVAGRSLYVSPDEPNFKDDVPYVYPPTLAVALVPLTVLSDHAAMVVAALGGLCAVIGALALVGVRDMRCYLAVLASAPTWNLLETGNVTALLTLGLALAWRYRATVWPLALVLGMSVALKLFAWPLVVWAAITNRLSAAVRAIAIAISVTACAWAAIGFQGLTEYPALVRTLYQAWAEDSYSIVGMASVLGLGSTPIRVVVVLVGCGLLTGCWRYARRGDDSRAFTCAVAAALAFTPIAWVHYLWFLLVPLGIARPRFSAVWLLPLLTWLVPRTGAR